MADNAVTMQPWTRDASGVQIGALTKWPYARPTLQDFLTAEIGAPVKILVAPKGYGKTLFLKQKAHNLRQRLKGVAVFPEASSDIEFLKLSLEWREVFQLTKPLTEVAWSLVWQFVLIGKGIQLVSAEDDDHVIRDEQLRGFFKDRRAEVGTLLTEALRQNHLKALNVVQKLPILRSVFNSYDHSGVILIDNTDEMFVGVDLESTTEKRPADKSFSMKDSLSVSENEANQSDISRMEESSLDPSIWASAQVGLMLAIREIERSTRKLNVYTSLRAEAILSAKHPLAQQAMVHTVRIQYSRADLKEVFAWHVALMKPTDLVKPDAVDAEERLIGENRILHSYVKVDGKPAVETLVELIARHTCYSPREMVILGEAIASLSVEERTGPDRDYLIRKRINDNAGGLYTSFRDNFIPHWPPEIDSALRSAPSAVMDSKSVLALGEVNAPKLYAYGLIGYSMNTQMPNRFRQVFLNQWDSRFTSDSLALPAATYYFLHPWLFDFCASHNKKFLRSPKNIIGDGCMFEPPEAAAVQLSRDSRDRPVLTIDGEIVWPTAASSRMTMPAMFLIIIVIAARTEGSTYISESAFKAAAESFRKSFPKLGAVQPLNPITRADHRAHIKKSVDAAFPSLRHKYSHLADLFEFPIGKVPERHVGLPFLDPKRIKVEI